jgi:ATP/maltotriose-dependent transcriptional regulator MalT
LENGPSNLRLIIASRSSLSGFSKLRARNKILEITSNDLRVTFSEAVNLLSSTCVLNLSSDNIIDLLQGVDGWVNGLQIAALSINRSTDIGKYIKEFSGKQHDFSEYLEHDIFSKLDQSLQRFMVETSVLEILNSDLCDVVTNRNDSVQVLRELRRMNLFIVTLDEHHSCFRYHHLFRDFLRNKLSNDFSQDLRLVHRRAYDWCLKNQMAGEAISHMVAANDWEKAADAIEQHIEDALSRNRLVTLKKWINSLPQEIVESCPLLLLALGWVAVLRRHVALATVNLDKAQVQFERLKHTGTQSDSDLKSISSVIEALMSVIVVVSDSASEIAVLAEKPTIDIPEEHSFFRNTYITALEYALMYQGQFDAGHRLAVEKEMASKPHNFIASIYTHIFRGLGYRLSGHYDSAKEQYEMSLQSAQLKLGEQWIPFTVPSVLLAEVYYEWGDLAAAAKDLEQLRPQPTEPVTKRDGWLEINFYIDIARARFELDQGNNDCALSLLQHQSAMAKRHGQRRYLIELLLLEGRVLSQQDKLKLAIKRVADAVALGERGHFLQCYLDADDNVQALIRSVLAQRPKETSRNNTDKHYLEKLRKSFDVVERGSSEPDTDILDVEPLTPREIDLLRLLSKGLKNKELAQEMNVSTHTIAWHLKNLYGKLRVDNRTAAVTVARRLQVK